LFQMMMSRVKWTVHVPQDASEDIKKKAVFLKQVQEDMEHSWYAFMKEAVSFYTYGFAPHEIVLRKRLKVNGSKYDDGLPTNKSKVDRFRPFGAATENGYVKIVKNCSDDLENKIFNDNSFVYTELEKFNGGRSGHDDICDSASDCFLTLAQSRNIPSFAVPVFTKSNEFRL